MVTKLYFALRALDISGALGLSFSSVYDAYVWHFTGFGERQSINSKNPFI